MVLGITPDTWGHSTLHRDMPGHPKTLLLHPQRAPGQEGCVCKWKLQLRGQEGSPWDGARQLSTSLLLTPPFESPPPSLWSPYDWALAAPALTRQQPFPMQIRAKRSSYWSTLGQGWKPSPSPGRDDCRLESHVHCCLPAEPLC